MAKSAVAPGIWRITVPLRSRPRTVHAYLVEAGEGTLAMVDGGANTDVAWRALESGVEEVASGWGKVRLHVVTHMHVDHIGLAPRIREATGAPLAMGRLDAERSAHAAAHPEEEARYRERLLTEAGVSPELVARAAAPAPAAGRAAYVSCDHPLPEPFSSLPGFNGWKAVWTPGHTAGHISLYRSDDGVLIAGDAVLRDVTPTIGVNRQRVDPVADYLDALARLEELRPRLVLPGHGAPITDPEARLAELRGETLEESERVLELIGEAGPTAAEVADARYRGRDLPYAQRVQAIRETLAHLHHLVRLGRAVSEPAGEVVRFWHS